MVALLAMVVVLVLAVGLIAFVRSTSVGTPDSLSHVRATVGIHRVRRELEVGILKAQISADAAKARRELDDELKQRSR